MEISYDTEMACSMAWEVTGFQNFCQRDLDNYSIYSHNL
jgi:hypothetical protein